MKTKRSSFAFFILLSAISLGLLACGESGPAVVSEIVITPDENGSTGDPVESLTPDNTLFHAIVRLNKSGGGASVKMELIAVETTEGNNVSVVSESKVVEGINNQVDFTISLPRSWPIGTYRIDTYLNDSLSMSKEFQIR